MSKKKEEETVCLTETQIEHIVDAARDVPGACPKAKKFVASLRPKKKDNHDSPALKLMEKTISRKVRNIINRISELF